MPKISQVQFRKIKFGQGLRGNAQDLKFLNSLSYFWHGLENNMPKRLFTCQHYCLDSRASPTLVRWAPALAVPHPKNRGGDPVKSSRTVQLSGDLVKDGFDPIEADPNAVEVEQTPNAQGARGDGSSRGDADHPW